MLQGRCTKPNIKMKSSKTQRKEAGSSFFKQDGAFFKHEKSPQKQRKPTVGDVKDKTNLIAKSVIQTSLDAPASFETKDRLVSSVQSYMALFCSLGDAGVSLSTSVHSVLSEIGFTEIAGQFSKGFNEINDISTATFNEVKDFVEKVVGAWEAQADGKNLTTQSVLQVLAYLLKTQLNFLQTASEHISEVLHTQYSGKTMLELLGGEAFFLTPPSTPTKPSTPPVCKPTHVAITTQVTQNCGAKTSSKEQVEEVLPPLPDSNQRQTNTTYCDGVVKEKTKPLAQQVTKSPVDSVHSVDSETSSKTNSEENICHAPPSDVELSNIIDLLSGTANQSQASCVKNSRSTNPPNHIIHGVPNHPSQYASFLYPPSANSYSQASQMVNQNVFMQNLDREWLPYELPSVVLDQRNNQALDDTGYTSAFLESHGHQPLAPKMAAGGAIKTAKTNTWPMRPSRETNVSQHNPPMNQPYGAIATDLEFSQYVNAVHRRTTRPGGSMGSRGSIDNPWSVGDSAMAWPPFGVNFESQERKQWPTEDSSNCSDESSSNNGGDWMIGPEFLSAMGNRDQRMAAKEAFNKAALTEPKSTNTWPLKQPGSGRAGKRSLEAQHAMCASYVDHDVKPTHLPLGVSLSEPQGFTKNWQTAHY